MRFNVYKNPSSITSSVVGAAFNPTLDAMKGLESADDQDGPWLLHRTGGVAPAPPASPLRRAGVASPYDVVQRRWNDPSTTPLPTPVHFQFVIKTDANSFTFSSRFQYWIGLFSASPDGHDLPPSGLQVAAFRFRPEAHAHWRVVGSNSSLASDIPPVSPIAVVENTEYLLEIKLQGTTAQFLIDGSLYQTLDTNSGDRLPDPGQPLGYGVRVFAYEDNGEDRTIRWKRISWDHV